MQDLFPTNLALTGTQSPRAHMVDGLRLDALRRVSGGKGR
jgi:hypothetical protein